ncbi:PSD1 and planctomycete cytochrome C domain-containing protein [Bryobacter aggregatus]|uniref:PSD1 and planctomycete cytochrome C domain-containing protein n=1 Tax=Bryobacter aggregatus TaxID=360054 RepID=UPI00068C5554|nr:PSD1 and planctomycete cytochrome C domain-containing protein [Bryobacter aggregatus]
MIRISKIAIRSKFNPLSILLCAGLCCYGQQKTVPRFETDVLPILQSKCLACHNAKMKQAELSLETRDDLLTGGKTGAAVVPGKAVDSLLLAMVGSGKMPMGGKPLPPEEAAAIRNWIDSGALKQGEEILTRPVPARDVFASILGAKCFVCHGRREQQGGLDLRTRESMLKGGKSGPALVPGDPEKSLIVQRIAKQQMPPPHLQEQFSVRGVDSGELEKLTQWIKQGARAETEKAMHVDPDHDPMVKDQDRKFWSFQQPQRPRVPAVAGQVRTPIDAFLLERLAAKKLGFGAEAKELSLLRRAYFDLIGLPPSPAQIQSYLADSGQDKYERLIDRLLASPRYGERWARYWLDAVGYADSEGGVSTDAVRPNAWRYRDYVIRALNADKPYSQFLQEQLAGDEMFDWKAAKTYTPDQVEKMEAVGFFRLAPDATYSTEQNFLPERFDAIAAEVEILGSSVMGLSLGCARCHDHKYDPIPQRDYYRVSAVFQTALDPYDWLIPSIECVGVGSKCEEKNLRFIPDPDPKVVSATEAHNLPLRQQIADLELKIETAAKPYREKAKADASIDDLLKDSEAFKKEVADLRKLVQQTKAKLLATPGFRSLFDMGGEPTPVRILLRGEVTNPGPLVEPGPLSVLSKGLPPYEPVKLNYQSGTSGRRLAFAKWITHEKHPLTARVMMNRVWQHHFGTGIVKSAGNFGKMGTPPTHPELLDWLSTEFVESGWSLKKMHRLIMTSAVYRQSSEISPEALAQDPSNELLSRFPLRRLDAEAVRDAILQSAGRLDPEAFGPPGVIEVKPDGAVLAKAGKLGYRRSIYLLQRRSTPVTMLDAFDLPFLSPNCVKRGESIVSSQALQLMNGDQIRETARYLAGRIIDAVGNDPRKQIDQLYLATLTRPARPAEVTAAEKVLAAMKQHWTQFYEATPPSEPIAGKAGHMALASLCHTLFNSAEFLYID